jgi:hypothetical protein
VDDGLDRGELPVRAAEDVGDLAVVAQVDLGPAGPAFAGGVEVEDVVTACLMPSDDVPPSLPEPPVTAMRMR